MEAFYIPLGMLVFGAIFVYSAVRRVQKKLDPSQNPTKWTYINELGGYFFLGILMVLFSIAWVFAIFTGTSILRSAIP